MRTPLPSNKTKSAFSLVELLVVIAIIGIIGSFAVPAVGQLLKGSSMTQAANMLTDQTATARQQALARNHSMEVRFYSFTNPEEPGGVSQYRALQYFEIAEGGIPNPTGRLMRFADTVIMNPDQGLSSIFSLNKKTPGANDPDLPRGVKRNYEYVAFRFLPDGTTSLPPTGGPLHNGQWFITVHLASDLGRTTGANPPPNFFTWMIDPVSGSTKILRPGGK